MNIVSVKMDYLLDRDIMHNRSVDRSESSMEYLMEMERWLKSPYVDQQTRNELLNAMENRIDIADRFYKNLEFGTAGLRGIIGAGSNRMNIYTVGRATQGLANYILSFGDRYRDKGVVIAYDTRHGSWSFALRTALVLAGNGIKAYLFEGHRPTPVLSFAVRHLGAAAGVVITASHNPSQYNGYKVYWEDGGQIVPDRAMAITEQINRVTGFEAVKVIERRHAVEKGLLKIIGSDVDRSYTESVLTLCIDRELASNRGGQLKVVYTPLHGTGSRPVQMVLSKAGFANLIVVSDQDNDDPDFPTVNSPNPEEREALELAIEQAEAEGADMVLGTDPDCDRLGIAVRNEGGRFEVLSGNQIGALITDYLLSRRKVLGFSKPGDVIIKSIVTDDMGKRIAEDYGVHTFETLTGFKYIGQKIEEFSRDGRYRFVFGYEESNGFLAGRHQD
jgi:phosphoglucomutase